MNTCTDAASAPYAIDLEIVEVIRPATRADEQSFTVDEDQPADDSVEPRQAIEDGEHQRLALVESAVAQFGQPNHLRYIKSRSHATWRWSWASPTPEFTNEIVQFVSDNQKHPKVRYLAYGDESPSPQPLDVTLHFWKVRWVEPKTHQLLPFQDSAFIAEEFRETSKVMVTLNASPSVILDLNMPFESVEPNFIRWHDEVSEALGKAIPTSRLRLAIPTKRGDSVKLRKLNFDRSDWP